VSELRIEDFIRLETEVWRALVDGNADADGRMLSDDFLGVYPTGFADRTDHVGQLIDGPTVATFELHDALMLVVSETAGVSGRVRALGVSRCVGAAIDVRQFVVVPPRRRKVGQRLQPRHAKPVAAHGAYLTLGGMPAMKPTTASRHENRSPDGCVLTGMRRIELLILGLALATALVLVTAGCGGGSGY
jgi:hypothetical protein